MPAVFSGEFVKRFVDHGAVICFQKFAIGLAPVHPAPFMRQFAILPRQPTIPAGSPVRLPASILVLIIPVTEFLAGHCFAFPFVFRQ